MKRREFLDKTSKAAAVAMTLPLGFSKSQALADTRKKRLVLVGTGSRGSGMWGKNLTTYYKNYVELVGLCDKNLKRVNYAKKYIGLDVPVFGADQFDLMIRQTKPDTVIVATTDCYHAEYIKRSLAHGCDVICEKPLITDEEQATEILIAERESGKKIVTTFNARHSKSSIQIKEILNSVELGRIISVDFQEYLDVYHGADYFRRWHGKIKYSGSLLVHKASHHFDQINWWLDADPVEVHAFGRLTFYGKNGSYRAKNCRECPFKDQCRFYWDISKNNHYVKLYVNCEDEDGYFRDGCVWNEENDSYDAMTVEVKYDNGVLLSYTLNAYMPYEGQRLAFNGENGRLDVRKYSRQPWEVEQTADMRMTNSFKGTKTWKLQPRAGEHGGADRALQNIIFIPGTSDPLKTMAGSRSGVMSSMIGIAARKSIQNGCRIRIRDLIDV